MKKLVNGIVMDMTAEEIAAMQEEARRAEEEIKAMPPTTEERLAAMESAMIALMGVV